MGIKLTHNNSIVRNYRENKMELPKFHETFNPILDILSDGKTIHHRELLVRVLDKYYSELPQELLEIKTKSGEQLILNRIAWGKSYLKKGGFITYPERGTVQITQKKGKDAFGKKLSLSDIENEAGFLQFYSDEKSKISNKELNSSSPQDLIDSGVSAIESQIKSELLEKLKSVDPYYFEKLFYYSCIKWDMANLSKHLNQKMEALMALSTKTSWVLIKYIFKQNDTQKIK